MKTFLQTLSLAVASAVTAEFLLGDQYLGGMAPAGQQITQLVLFTAFYGSAAVLIRELARRARIGWPGILTLALGFGVLEEGVLTQSLFNPDYAGQHLTAYGLVPWLGTSGPWLVFVLTLHVVWSMGSPVAVMEGAYGDRPWMRHSGWLAVPAVLFLLGAAAIFAASTLMSGYLANPVELVVSALIAAALVVVAFTLLPRAPRDTSRPSRRVGAQRPRVGYLWALVIGFVLSSGFQLLHELPHTVSPWVPTIAMLLVLAIGVVFAFLLRPDALGFGSGAILTYCWVGLANAANTGAAAVVEQIVLVAIAVAVLVVIGWRHVLRARTAPAETSMAPAASGPEHVA